MLPYTLEPCAKVAEVLRRAAERSLAEEPLGDAGRSLDVLEALSLEAFDGLHPLGLRGLARTGFAAARRAIIDTARRVPAHWGHVGGDAIVDACEILQGIVKRREALPTGRLLAIDELEELRARE